MKENELLRADLAQSKMSQNLASISIVNISKSDLDKGFMTHSFDLPEGDRYENLLFQFQVKSTLLKIHTPSQVRLPTRECSATLVSYSNLWTSWIHCALDYPTFEKEHDAFWDSLHEGASLGDIDPAWLAIYFSVIGVS